MTAIPMRPPREQPAPGRFRTVVLATDLSPTSEAATIVTDVASDTVADPLPQNNSDTNRVAC